MLDKRGGDSLIIVALLFVTVMCILLLLVCYVPESVDTGQVTLTEWFNTLH